MTSSSGLGGSFQVGWQIEAGYDSETGAQLWITNRTETPFTRLSSHLFFTDGSGVYAEINRNTFTITGYSDYTGTQLWTTPLPNPNPYDTDLIDGQVANGTLYLYGLGGDVYAMNMATGAILWSYTTGSAGYDTPYGVWPIWTLRQ